MTSKPIKTLAISLLSASLLSACGGPSPFPLQAPFTQFRSPALLNSFSTGERDIPGQLVIKYRQGGASALASSFQHLGVQRVKSVGPRQFGLELVRLAPGQSTAKTIQTLQKHPAVAYVEPVFTIPFPHVTRTPLQALSTEPAAYPNDPMFSKQYSHRVSNSGQGWQINKGNPATIVAIVDSGVDVTHPDLKEKIVGTHNSADDNDEVVDHVGHGTHVAGIAAATTNNGLGVAGVAADCKILAVKVASGESMSPSTVGIANGVLWAADHGAAVINLSLGSSRESKVITDAVKYALAKNVVVVVAMGNDGGHVKSWPAAVEGVIAVGSTDSSDKRSRFSNYGDWISVTAPGSDILSTFPLGENAIGPKEYGSISGTSMATPFVTGLVGLIRSQSPNLTVADVKHVIEESADDLGDKGFDDKYGHGRVSVGNTLSKLASRR